MEVLHTLADVRARLARERAIVLVPTMGNLHPGHIALAGRRATMGNAWWSRSS
jgi:pantoate--beta-alanine ligase